MMHLCVAWTVLCALLLGAVRPAVAADWPQWRGPNRDGVSTETGLLQSWEEGGPPLLWTAKGLGSGYASVAVVKGRIYSMGTIKGQESVMALDSAGKRIWATPIGGGGEPNCTPTYDDGLVYALTKKGDFACVDAKSGKIRWSKNFPKDFGGQMMSGWGYSESPLIDGNRVICSPGSNDAAIVALDKKTGKVIWKAKAPSAGGAGYSSIVVAEVGGIRQYIQLMGRGLIAVDAKDGKFLWNYNRIANGTANIPTPVVKDNYVFCSTGYGTGAALLELTSNDGGVDAKEVYFLPADKLQNHHGGMILVGEHIYCGHGHNNGFPICVKMATGDIAWSKGRGPGSGSAAVVYADGHFYFRYESGVMALIEATPEEYRQKGTFKIPHNSGPSWPHPVISDGKLYLRSQDVLMCYDVKQH
jgi:outer membrane protein assembly factor BamB